METTPKPLPLNLLINIGELKKNSGHTVRVGKIQAPLGWSRQKSKFQKTFSQPQTTEYPVRKHYEIPACGRNRKDMCTHTHTHICKHKRKYRFH